MPQAGIAAVLEAIGVGAATAAAYAAVIQTILINVALGYLSKKLAKRPDNVVPPINVTVRNSIEPRRIILGTRRTGGVLDFFGTSSSSSSVPTADILWYVIVLAGHQVSAIKDVWLDNEKIANADINGGVSTGGIVGGSSKFAGKVSIFKHLGTGAQTVNTAVDTAFTEWTSAFRLRGCAYIAVKLTRDDTLFSSGAPQMITALVDGALLYDPRLDSTNGGSGTHRKDDPSTWAFSRNPALQAIWYLTGGSVVNDQSTRMVMYGLREAYTRIPWDYAIAAANHCDETLSGANAPPAGSQTRYCCDIEASCGENRRDIFNPILESMAGTAVLVKGQWRVFAGVYDTPIHTLDSSDLYADLEIQDTTTHGERYNAVDATYIDPTNGYIDATTIFRTDSSYETQDNGEQIQNEIDLRDQEAALSYAAHSQTARKPEPLEGRAVGNAHIHTCALQLDQSSLSLR
jgi:hypothetical protein